MGLLIDQLTERRESDVWVYLSSLLPYLSEVKSQVLCLPFFSGVSDEDVEALRTVFHGV